MTTPTSASYSAMAWSLLAWFGLLGGVYVGFLVVRWMRRLRALHRELAGQEMVTLRPTLASTLPAPPNSYVADPPIYTEAV
jgi:hypothetical protein